VWLCWRLSAWLSTVWIPIWGLQQRTGNRHEHVKEEKPSKRRAHRPHKLTASGGPLKKSLEFQRLLVFSRDLYQV
jgi:hypothetical protein